MHGFGCPLNISNNHDALMRFAADANRPTVKRGPITSVDEGGIGA